MKRPSDESISRRDAIKVAGIGAVSLGMGTAPTPFLDRAGSAPDPVGVRRAAAQERPFPAPEEDGGWAVASPGDMGAQPARFAEAMAYHDRHVMTTSYGGALAVVY